MLIDQTHKSWLLATLGTTVLLTISYLFYVSVTLEEVTGGTVPGLIYGSLALLILIFASLLGLRKKVPAWRIGRATDWLKGHAWLSLLLIPLLFFHSGFRWGGPLTSFLWVLFGLVMVSGLIGVLLQQFLPRLMTETVPMETIYAQIAHVVNQLRYEADVRVVTVAGALGFEITPPEGIPPAKIKEVAPQEGSDILKKFYLEKIRPCLDPRKKFKEFFESADQVVILLEQFRLNLPPFFHETARRLKDLLEERRQLDRQKRLHHWMHSWLFVHVPISVVFLLLARVHSYTALHY